MSSGAVREAGRGSGVEYGVVEATEDGGSSFRTHLTFISVIQVEYSNAMSRFNGIM